MANLDFSDIIAKAKNMEVKSMGRIRSFLHTIPGRTAAFLLPMLLLLLVSVAWVTHSSQAALQREIVAWNGEQASADMEQLMLSLNRTIALQRSLLYDSDINRLGVMPGYFTQPQKIRSMLRVMERMSQLAGSSPFIQSAEFLAPSVSRVISDSEVNPLSEEEYRRINDLYLVREQTFTQIDGETCIMMPYPSYHNYLKENGASYLICVKVNWQEVASFLASHSVMKDEATFLFTRDGEAVCAVKEEAAEFDTALLHELAQTSSAFELTGNDGRAYLGSAVQSGEVNPSFMLVKLQPAQRAFSELTTQRNFFIALFILVIVINLLYMVHLWHVIYKPLNKLSRAFQQVEQGHFDLRIHHNRDDDFADIYHSFNQMNERLGELIEQAYMQTIRTQRAELKQLQSQINPHFLYNNLFMIRSLAQLGDTDMIETLAADLGEYFRYINRTGSQEAPLSMEVAHARNYAQLQDMRFSTRIHLHFEALPEEFADATVPRLILQPLIENAYQHGLKDTLSRGELHVGFEADGQDILIIVEDNGPDVTEPLIRELTASLSNPDVQETTGMINIHRRLRLRYGEPYGLSFSRSPLGGFRAAMRIPLKGDEAGNAARFDR